MEAKIHNARRSILITVNKWRIERAMRFRHPIQLYTMRHINRAVHCARQNKLMAPKVLEDAGFRGDK